MSINNSHLLPYFLRLAESSQDVFWIKDADNQQLLYISPSYETIWGRSCSSLYQKPAQWLEFVYKEDKDFVNDSFYRRLASDKSVQQEELVYRIIRPDNEIRWIAERYLTIKDNNVLIGFISIARDITLSKTKEQELLAIAEKAEQANFQKTQYLLSLQNSSIASINQVLGSNFFMQLAEKSENVFWVRSANYGIQLYLSPAYEKIWARSREELYKNPALWGDSIHPEDKKELLHKLLLNQDDTDNEIKSSMYRIVRPNGNIRWIKDTSFAINDNQGKCIGFAGIAEDITEKRQKEHALLEAKERAEIANKAKSDFLATMSHELRTPLNGILGIAQILTAAELSPTHKEYLSDIIFAGKHLLSLVNDMLDFAKLESGKVELESIPINLQRLLDEIIVMMRYQIGQKDINLILDYDQATPMLFLTDPKAIRQIMVNLLGNAVKFSEQGQIIVKVKTLEVNNSKQRLAISVSDTGIGIPEHMHKAIFERFQQLDASQSRRYGGTGLGLAITQQIIQLMGGNISVNSELGKGSTFSFDINLEKQPNENEPQLITETKVHQQTDKPKDTKYHILLVEDNPLNQKIGKIMLEDIGCSVCVFENSQQVFASNLSEFDLIFMDIGLPDISGIEITKKIRSNDKFSYLPIIAMTAHAYQGDKDDCLAAGMNDVITKPVMEDELKNILIKWLPKFTQYT